MMLRPYSPLDEATVRLEARRMYKKQGKLHVYKVIYEMLCAVNIFLDIIHEESGSYDKDSH